MEKAIIRTQGSYYARINARQHSWFVDVDEASEGTDLAPTPEEMLLGALGSCMAITAKMYARRKGWDLQDVDIELEVERFNGSDYPQYEGDSNFVHEIRERVVLKGDLDDDQKTRILDIMKKCPVRRIVTTPSFFVESLVDAIAEAEVSPD